MEPDAALPRLYTPRLCLRALGQADASRVQELAGDKRVACTTARIPHPYPDGAAEAFIATLSQAAAQGTEYIFGITLAGTRTPGREGDLSDTGHFVGSIGLRRDGEPDQERAELGYWIGVPYWNKGFATEAARVVLEFAFARLHLRRIVARHYTANPASGRVLKKLGMTHEGVLHRYEVRWNEERDVDVYGLHADDWSSAKKRRKIGGGAALQPA
jgi:RimJ/RimL family protein N-acetyltransferase